MLLGMCSLAAALQLEIYWVYTIIVKLDSKRASEVAKAVVKV